ncbi:hypothetical protein L3Q82_019890 [Scortum barcoo]|uniref:Uncharacterized protein n=1 Tax=Scortum barcoo TaxID=214431 RepID=A0ACB8VDB0_9TELE|nr:hypothetical protein L3Q82_019890 [Scortum barcoo]
MSARCFQRLLENRLFAKKEKCEFHASPGRLPRLHHKREGCVQADPAKVRAVAEWPIPTNRKLLQRFLGFANFYRRFIRNYSQEAGAPDSSHLPRPITTSGNRELLAVKMALEEWRHWLEGSTQPFVVWTDHKNLAYIQTAKRLNSRQARWSLFFSRFDFFSVEEKVQEENILPTSRVIAAITWDIENAVLRAQQQQPDPGQGPPGRLFVPGAVRSQVLQWAHSSKLSCHPGINRTISLIKRHFWWRNMEADIRGFVQACTVCARGKSSHQPPSGLLQPLSVPGRPWSHIALDFVTGLPPSNGKTVILTIVDRFSKAAHFVALAKLPTARETADLLANHVVRLHGIPWDIVSDRGPQFISQVWKSFCTGLGASSESHLGVPSSIKRADGEDEPGPRVSATLCHGRQQQSTWCTYPPSPGSNSLTPFPG